MDPDRLALTKEQALNAICLDFRGYGPQPMLFCQVLRTIHGDALIARRQQGRDGLWIAIAESHRMRWLEGAELVDFMCRQVLNFDPEPEQMASLCRQVFQTACQVVWDRAAAVGQWSVCIDSGMASFHCRQCGGCCRLLDYKDGMTAGDVARLKQLGRFDVLEWVGISKDADGREIYRIWIIPGTNQYASPCPFLKRGSSEKMFLCRIHDIKPHICRHYPVSRKHARMTGCPGFDKTPPGP